MSDHSRQEQQNEQQTGVDEVLTEQLQQRMRQGNPQQQLLFWALEHSDPKNTGSAAAHSGKTREEIEESRKWLEAALQEGVEVTTPDGNTQVIRTKNIIESMKKCIETLDNVQSEFSARMDALMEIDECVDKIDFANDFTKLGGIQCLARIIFPDTAASLYASRDIVDEEELIELQIEALNVLGTCAQNNPFVQDHLLHSRLDEKRESSGHMIGRLLDAAHTIIHQVQDDRNTQTQNLLKKYIFAWGCILSNNINAVKALYDLDQGLEKLASLLKSSVIGDQTKARIILIIFTMLTTESEAGSTTLAHKLFEQCQIHRILFDILQDSIKRERLELIERSLQMLQELIRHSDTEPSKSIVQAIRRESLAQSSGFTAFRKKVLATKPPADELEDRWYDIRPYLEQIVLT